MPTETKDHFRTAVALPESIIVSCTTKASKSGRKLEDWISERLRKCRDHDAQRGLYFDDKQREALEQLLGGVILANADDAIRLMTSRYTLTVGDEKGIPVEEGIYVILKQRAEETSTTLAALLREAATNGLNDFTYGGH